MCDTGGESTRNEMGGDKGRAAAEGIAVGAGVADDVAMVLKLVSGPGSGLGLTPRALRATPPGANLRFAPLGVAPLLDTALSPVPSGALPPNPPSTPP